MSDDILSAVQALEGQPGPEDMKEKDSGIATSTNNVIHTNTGPMTLLSVELDAHDDPHQAIIAEALRQQQQGGTQLIVHIEEGSTQNMQVLLDGKLVPVSSISDVIQKDALTTTTPLPRPAPIKMAGIRPVVPIVQKTIEDAGFAAIVGRKRKRHHSLMRDEQTQLSGESFKSQLLDTSDTIKGLDLAPPTKLVMDYTSTIDLDTLFGFPSRPHSSKPILDAFSRNLDVVKLENKCRKRAKLPEPKDADLSLDITSMITNHDFGFQML